MGTLIGGPIGDRIGRKPILWLSILGVLPLSLALPFVSLFWTDVLAVLIGSTMASAFRLSSSTARSSCRVASA